MGETCIIRVRRAANAGVIQFCLHGTLQQLRYYLEIARGELPRERVKKTRYARITLAQRTRCRGEVFDALR